MVSVLTHVLEKWRVFMQPAMSGRARVKEWERVSWQPPVASSPSAAPVTSSQTAAPVTPSPSAAPVTTAPMAAPVTPSPSAAPVTTAPTAAAPMSTPGWNITYDSMKVNLTADTTEELIFVYNISSDRAYEFVLFEKDCSTETGIGDNLITNNWTSSETNSDGTD
eukprot:scaffold248420_cov82-Cyclotella_meneghiniana.AAC.1